MIQVFSAGWCKACKTVKNFLTASNINFVERDIDSDQDAYNVITNLKIRSIPVVYLDDNNYVIGFDKNKILELVNKDK